MDILSQDDPPAEAQPSSPPTLSRSQQSRLFPSSSSPVIKDNTANSYAFLVHSQETIPHNLPPSVDNKPLARQRRRRTSPEDQAILETEFQHNPKPDKTARQRIVERVALGDKEVQIWFQNRRQTSRRKSRPLDSQEPHTLARHDNTATLRSELSSSSTDSSALLSSSPRLEPISTPVRHSDILKYNLQTTQEDVPPTPAQIQEDSSFCYGLQTSAVLGRPIPSQEAYDNVACGTIPSSDAVIHSQADPENLPQSPLRADLAGPQSLKRSASTMRLSLKSDYTAKISQPDEESPSPPNAQRSVDMLNTTPARTNLRRSHSAAGYGDSLGSSASKKILSSGLRGRSRDSRAWEFWCDKDARTDLLKKAEQETRGSAADAISMIRSSSKRSALSPISPFYGPDDNTEHHSVKRMRSSLEDDATSNRHDRPKLSRAQTSVGKLESQNKKRDSGVALEIFDDVDTSPTATHSKKAQPSIGVPHSPSGESDKENHDPDAELVVAGSGLPHRHSGNKAGRNRPSFGSSQTAPLPSIRRFGMATDSNRFLGRRRARNVKAVLRPSLEGAENNDPEDDAEIAAFMRRTSSVGRSSHSGRDEDDMDCVQGLLRLSQGAWR